MTERIPLVDLTPWYAQDEGAKAVLCERFDAALRDIGFLVVIGHRVAPATLTQLRAAARRFFALTPEVKQHYASIVGGRGWVAPRAGVQCRRRRPAGAARPKGGLPVRPARRSGPHGGKPGRVLVCRQRLAG